MSKTTSLRPLAGKVVVRPDKAEERRGQILIPDAHRERPCRGTVLAVGPPKAHPDRALVLYYEFGNPHSEEAARAEAARLESQGLIVALQHVPPGLDRAAEPTPLLGVGDSVCYPWATGHRFDDGGGEVLVLDQDAVLAVIEGE